MLKTKFMIATNSYLHPKAKTLTQLLVALANIIAHDGNFDKIRPKGGNLLHFFGEVVFPDWINLSSDLLMKLLSEGSSVT
jgi:hypothetical protein